MSDDLTDLRDQLEQVTDTMADELLDLVGCLQESGSTESADRLALLLVEYEGLKTAVARAGGA